MVQVEADFVADVKLALWSLAGLAQTNREATRVFSEGGELYFLTRCGRSFFRRRDASERRPPVVFFGESSLAVMRFSPD